VLGQAREVPRAVLGYLYALGRLANAVMPMTAARFGVMAELDRRSRSDLLTAEPAGY
jgi:hypothetical protein